MKKFILTLLTICTLFSSTCITYASEEVLPSKHFINDFTDTLSKNDQQSIMHRSSKLYDMLNVQVTLVILEDLNVENKNSYIEELAKDYAIEDIDNQLMIVLSLENYNEMSYRIGKNITEVFPVSILEKAFKNYYIPNVLYNNVTEGITDFMEAIYGIAGDYHVKLISNSTYVDSERKYWVNDYANVLTEQTEETIALYSRELYSRTNDIQLSLITLESAKDWDIRKTALEVFDYIKKDEDTGATDKRILLVYIKDTNEIELIPTDNTKALIFSSEKERIVDDYLIPNLKKNSEEFALLETHIQFCSSINKVYEQNLKILEEYENRESLDDENKIQNIPSQYEEPKKFGIYAEDVLYILIILITAFIIVTIIITIIKFNSEFNELKKKVKELEKKL